MHKKAQMDGDYFQKWQQYQICYEYYFLWTC